MTSKIRWMTNADIIDSVRIDNESFSQPWCKEDFFRCLKDEEKIGKVIECNGKVAGYFIYQLMDRKLYLVRIAVSPCLRGFGLGRQMVGQLIDKIFKSDRTRIDLHISESNLSAHKFFSRIGFKAICVDRDFFVELDNMRDAYCFSYIVGRHNDKIAFMNQSAEHSV